jgi:hypothetical protein
MSEPGDILLQRGISTLPQDCSYNLSHKIIERCVSYRHEGVQFQPKRATIVSRYRLFLHPRRVNVHLSIDLKVSEFLLLPGKNCCSLPSGVRTCCLSFHFHLAFLPVPPQTTLLSTRSYTSVLCSHHLFSCTFQIFATTARICRTRPFLSVSS